MEKRYAVNPIEKELASASFSISNKKMSNDPRFLYGRMQFELILLLTEYCSISKISLGQLLKKAKVKKQDYLMFTDTKKGSYLVLLKLLVACELTPHFQYKDGKRFWRNNLLDKKG